MRKYLIYLLRWCLTVPELHLNWLIEDQWLALGVLLLLRLVYNLHLRYVSKQIILIIVLLNYTRIGIYYIRLLKFQLFYLILYRIWHQQELTLLERLEWAWALFPYRAGVDRCTLILLDWQHLDEFILV